MPSLSKAFILFWFWIPVFTGITPLKAVADKDFTMTNRFMVLNKQKIIPLNLSDSGELSVYG
jgi:hypothetical protein